MQAGFSRRIRLDWIELAAHPGRVCKKQEEVQEVEREARHGVRFLGTEDFRVE